jgi:hypothetical protein
MLLTEIHGVFAKESEGEDDAKQAASVGSNTPFPG